MLAVILNVGANELPSFSHDNHIWPASSVSSETDSVIRPSSASDELHTSSLAVDNIKKPLQPPPRSKRTVKLKPPEAQVVMREKNDNADADRDSKPLRGTVMLKLNDLLAKSGGDVTSVSRSSRRPVPKPRGKSVVVRAHAPATVDSSSKNGSENSASSSVPDEAKKASPVPKPRNSLIIVTHNNEMNSSHDEAASEPINSLDTSSSQGKTTSEPIKSLHTSSQDEATSEPIKSLDTSSQNETTSEPIKSLDTSSQNEATSEPIKSLDTSSQSEPTSEPIKSLDISDTSHKTDSQIGQVELANNEAPVYGEIWVGTGLANGDQVSKTSSSENQSEGKYAENGETFKTPVKTFTGRIERTSSVPTSTVSPRVKPRRPTVLPPAAPSTSLAPSVTSLERDSTKKPGPARPPPPIPKNITSSPRASKAGETNVLPVSQETFSGNESDDSHHIYTDVDDSAGHEPEMANSETVPSDNTAPCSSLMTGDAVDEIGEYPLISCYHFFRFFH